MGKERELNGGPGAQKAETPESRARDDRATGRVWDIVQRMARQEWVRGQTAGELAAEWGVSQSTVENYSAEAGRLMRLFEAREDVLTLVRANAARRLDVAEDMAFVAVARLLVDTVGGFTQKQEITVKEIAGLPPRQVHELVILELVKDDEAAAFFERARRAHLEGRALLTTGIDTTEYDSPLTDGSGAGITDGEETDTCET